LGIWEKGEIGMDSATLEIVERTFYFCLAGFILCLIGGIVSRNGDIYKKYYGYRKMVLGNSGIDSVKDHLTDIKTLLENIKPFDDIQRAERDDYCKFIAVLVTLDNLPVIQAAFKGMEYPSWILFYPRKPVYQKVGIILMFFGGCVTFVAIVAMMMAIIK
jgi:hypothetical protein